MALYPMDGPSGFLQHWNAGHCCGKRPAISRRCGVCCRTIEDVCVRFKVDRNRIYMVGFQWRYADVSFCSGARNLLAAAAPMAASIGGRPSEDLPEWRIPECVRPIPIIVFHGCRTMTFPMRGSQPPQGGTRSYWSVEESVQFWVTRNGAAPGRQQGLECGSVLLKSWVDCKDKADVALYLIRDWAMSGGQLFYGSLGRRDPLKILTPPKSSGIFLNRISIKPNFKIKLILEQKEQMDSAYMRCLR